MCPHGVVNLNPQPLLKNGSQDILYGFRGIHTHTHTHTHTQTHIVTPPSPFPFPLLPPHKGCKQRTEPPSKLCDAIRLPAQKIYITFRFNKQPGQSILFNKQAGNSHNSHCAHCANVAHNAKAMSHRQGHHLTHVLLAVPGEPTVI